MRRAFTAAARGFTLIEAIIVIVVLGVLGSIVAVFIRAPMQGYVDSVGRAAVTDEADLALRRMARDIRLALPNSIRIHNNGGIFALELLMTTAGGRYLSADDGVDGQVLDFLNPANGTFSVVGAMRSLNESIAAGQYVVVNNLGPEFIPSDAYLFGTPNRNIARIASFVTDAGNVTSITFVEEAGEEGKPNPFGTQDPPMPSPTQRFQLVSGPVSFVCTPQPDGTGILTRHWGYGIESAQPVPPAGGQSALLAKRVDNCGVVFNYGAGATQRSGLVILTLALRARNENDPAIRLVHQVHVDNTP